MAGQIFTADTTTAVALSSSSEKCMIRLIAPSSHAIKIKEWGVYFDGVTANATPCLVRICLTDTSYGNYTTHVPAKRVGEITAAQSVVQTMNTSSGPSIFGVLASRNVHPQSGYQEKFAYGDEMVVVGPTTAAGGCVSLLINSPTTVDAIAEIVFEE